MAPINSTQDFDGHFTMKVPLGEHYRDVAWCLPNGALGCACEYREKDSSCEVTEGEMVVYYYNDSQLVEGESNAWQHAVNDLNKSYLYQIQPNDGNLLILTNDIGMRSMPPYLVGMPSDDKSEAVFVGGYNLEDLKNSANTIKFN